MLKHPVCSLNPLRDMGMHPLKFDSFKQIYCNFTGYLWDKDADCPRQVGGYCTRGGSSCQAAVKDWDLVSY